MNDLVDPFRDWDAAYVLGSLGMDDRRTYERHLLKCGSCTKSVGEIAGIPGVLMKLSPGSAQALLDTVSEVENLAHNKSDLVQSLASAVVARRQRVRRRFIAMSSVAAALLMVVGIGVGTQVHSSRVLGRQVAMTELIPNSMTVNLHILGKKWGSQITWDCTYARLQPDNASAEPYNLVITDKAGLSTVVASWQAIGTSAKGLVASTKLSLAQIKSIEIRDAGSIHPIVRGVVQGSI